LPAGAEVGVDDGVEGEVGSVGVPLSEVLSPQAVTPASTSSPQTINRRVMGAPPTSEDVPKYQLVHTTCR
jgi:hypothetical protein